MRAYRGNELKGYITELKQEAMQRTGLDQVYERDFVDFIRNYCFEGKTPVVYIVCGLHATGKTFGILQAVSHTDDTIYIRAQRDKPQTGRDYIEFLRNTKEKNIIMDEYTWIKDSHDLNRYLQALAENGKRVVITGMHSLKLEYLRRELFRRAIPVNINLFSYEEFCRVYRKSSSKESFMEFLQTGGVFKEYAVTGFKDMAEYIKEAVTDELKQLMDVPDETAEAAVYHIMYLAACGRNITRVDDPGIRKTDSLYRNLLTSLGIDPDMEIRPFYLRVAADVLENAKFIVKTHSITSKGEYRLHLVNPSLAYQMANTVFGKKTADERLGKAFEAYMVTFMTTRTNTSDYIWYADMGQKEGKPELELVIVNPDDHLVYLFDSKLREAASLPENSSLVSKELDSLFTGAEVAGRYVVCNTKEEKCGIRNGKKVIFTRLDCETLQNYRRFDENYNRLSNAHDGNSNEENTDYTEEPQEPEEEQDI